MAKRAAKTDRATHDHEAQEPEAEIDAEEDQRQDGQPDEGPASELEAVEAALGQPDGQAEGGEGGEDGDEPPAGETGEAEDGEAPKGEKDGEDGEGDEAEGTKPAADEDIYSVPKDLEAPGKEKTRERFERLVAGHKEMKREREALGEQVRAFQQVVQLSGASPQEFQELITFSSLVKSGDPANLQKALGMIEHYRGQLAAALGQELPGVDLLSEHTDLRDAVQNLEITRERALELATMRNRQRQDAAAREEQARRAQGQQQVAQTAQQAIQELNHLDRYWQTNDPDFTVPGPDGKSLRDILLEKAREVAAAMPNRPDAWGPTMLQHYQTLKWAMSQAKTRTPTPGRHQQPLRPSGAAGGGRREPKSELEAIEQVLGNSAV